MGLIFNDDSKGEEKMNPRYVTGTGIEIGVAYQRKPDPMGSHAEKIQEALLASRSRIMGSGGAMKVSEKDLDAQIEENRRFYERVHGQSPEPQTMMARILRRLRGLL